MNESKIVTRLKEIIVDFELERKKCLDNAFEKRVTEHKAFLDRHPDETVISPTRESYYRKEYGDDGCWRVPKRELMTCDNDCEAADSCWCTPSFSDYILAKELFQLVVH